ncbi:hypothetical protein [Pantoea sp.]|uniref:DUF7940 domain-containing protein n=1 Tax=Pantoea sp. TaxID=69393 RepID=UPI00289D062B|nr:hypothetical protein [Pantoea sp.]
MTFVIWILIILSVVVVALAARKYTSVEFVAHAKLLFKAWSVWLASIGATLSVFLMSAPDVMLSAWSSLPDEIKNLIPPQWLTYIGPGLVMLGVVSQFIRQKKLLEQKERMDGQHEH